MSSRMLSVSLGCGLLLAGCACSYQAQYSVRAGTGVTAGSANAAPSTQGHEQEAHHGVHVSVGTHHPHHSQGQAQDGRAGNSGTQAKAPTPTGQSGQAAEGHAQGVTPGHGGSTQQGGDHAQSSHAQGIRPQPDHAQSSHTQGSHPQADHAQSEASHASKDHSHGESSQPRDPNGHSQTSNAEPPSSVHHGVSGREHAESKPSAAYDRPVIPAAPSGSKVALQRENAGKRPVDGPKPAERNELSRKLPAQGEKHARERLFADASNGRALEGKVPADAKRERGLADKSPESKREKSLEDKVPADAKRDKETEDKAPADTKRDRAGDDKAPADAKRDKSAAGADKKPASSRGDGKQDKQPGSETKSDGRADAK